MAAMLSPSQLKRDATARWLLSLKHAPAAPRPASAIPPLAGAPPRRLSPGSRAPVGALGAAPRGRELDLRGPLGPLGRPRAPPRAPLKVFLNLGQEPPREGGRGGRAKLGRLRVFVLIYAAYVGLLIARKNYGFWIPHVMDSLGRSKSEVAVIGSAYEMASGAGALLNGMVIDAVDPSLALSLALAASALLNFGLSGASSLPVMAALWGANGIVQSLGWPCVSKVFLRAFPDPKGRGVWYSILSTSQNVGAALVPVLVAHAVARSGNPRVAFYLPAAIALGLGLLLLRVLWRADEPQTTTPAAAAAVAARAREAAAAAAARRGKKGKAFERQARLRALRATARDVLLNWRLWLMAVDYFCIGVIRSCLTDWTPLYLAEAKGQPMHVASRCLFSFELGGFIGSVAAGRASDLIFHGRRGPVMALCTALLCPLLALLDATSDARALPLLYFGLGALAFPVHVLLGLASREVVAPAASSTAGGLVKFVAQLGASSAGFPLGMLQKHKGWRAVFALLASVALAGGACVLPLWRTVARVDERAIERRHRQKGG